MKSTEEYSGGSVSYYAVDINRPLDENSDPYKAECQDIIDALGMDFNEGCAFKAIWRRAAARNLGLRKKGYDEGLYDAQKVEFYGGRMVAKAGPPAGRELDDAELLPAGPEGWIAHIGGPMPIAEGTLVQVRYRCGDKSEGTAGEEDGPCSDWTHTDHSYDIVAYRLA